MGSLDFFGGVPLIGVGGAGAGCTGGSLAEFIWLLATLLRMSYTANADAGAA